MSDLNTTNTFIVKVGDKHIVCVRTDTNRFFQIAHHRLLTDGLVPRAEPISMEKLADLISKYGISKLPYYRVKGRASIKKRRREVSQYRISEEVGSVPDYKVR
ncbi:MAG: hypothetical protein ACRD8Z_27925 [Nitrososphaeraceae archaeon]